ncbi:Uncharacterised protein [Bordetella trematum]|nr:Uncharacterised protein [Bordetella trematum]
MAPLSMVVRRSATSSCTHSTRRAEQRCPALSKADITTSWTTCSASADESTIMAFWPPVSATSGTGPPCADKRWASTPCSSRATSVEPVNMTPWTRASPVKKGPTSRPRPGTSCKAARGTPACHNKPTACAATRLVCSAGLASTVLPAASAAATWPVKIASGKFQGLMQVTGPSGRWVALSKVALTWAA